LQLLNHFLKLSIRRADLVLYESGSFLQIDPDVAHGRLPAFAAPNSERPGSGPLASLVDKAQPLRKGRPQLLCMTTVLQQSEDLILRVLARA
jgi:hypothetical protein